MRLAVFPLALLVALGCRGRGLGGGSAESSAPMATPHPADGAGVVVNVPRRMALWVQIRSSALTRAEGWSGAQLPMLVAFPTRGVNPVFVPEGQAYDVAWIDGNKVIAVHPGTRGRGGFDSPPSEATAAVVAMPGATLDGLVAGDRIRLIGGADDR